MNRAYLLIGGNIDNRLQYLQQAVSQIENRAGVIIKKSTVYETAAWGLTNQKNFLNQALIIDTRLSPDTLLGTVLSIETDMGRKRTEKLGPRTIDIDILFYDSYVCTKTNLVIPHPQVANRKFVLQPLSEIAPQLIHPLMKKNIDQLLAECPDQLLVTPHTPIIKKL